VSDRALTRATGRGVVATVTAVALMGTVGVAAAQNGADQGAAFVDSVRSVSHILGIIASLAVAYYGFRARQQFEGGLFGEVAIFVVLGGLVFAAAFVQMELQHGFGIDVLSFTTDMQLKMGIRMVLFTVTVFAFGWAFYRMGSALKGV
jgi:hypothetical protein